LQVEANRRQGLVSREQELMFTPEAVVVVEKLKAGDQDRSRPYTTVSPQHPDMAVSSY
jgi:hypothetical protein